MKLSLGRRVTFRVDFSLRYQRLCTLQGRLVNGWRMEPYNVIVLLSAGVRRQAEADTRVRSRLSDQLPYSRAHKPSDYQRQFT